MSSSFNVPKLSPNALKGDKIDLGGKKGIVLFYADWCGYCQKFKPTFQQLYKDTQNSNVKAMHCPDAQEACTAFGVSSYPTVMFVDTDGTTSTAPRELEALKSWLKQSGGRRSRRRRSPRKHSSKTTKRSRSKKVRVSGKKRRTTRNKRRLSKKI